MNEVKKFYERAKLSAKNHMKNGQINDYLNDLLIMNHYKKLMDAAIIYALAYPYPQTLEGFKSQVDAISSFDAIDRIRNIRHNTLIMSGREDILITPEESRSLLEISGPTVFKILDNAAHSIHAENPHAFVEAVVGFLRDG